MEVKNRRVVLFGCQKIAIDVIEFIKDFGCKIGIDNEGNEVTAELVGVITHDEDRDKMFCDKLVSEYCVDNGIYNTRFEGKIDEEIIRALNPDIPKMGVINIHPADLPKNRGPNPTYWAVRRGDAFTSTTLHYVDEGMDTGDIISYKSKDIHKKTGFEVNKIMMGAGLDLFKENYCDIMCGKNKRSPQSLGATCNVAFKNNMRYIDWGLDAECIVNHIRAHADPYAGSLAVTAKGTEIVIYEAEVIGVERGEKGPGSYEMTECGIIVQTRTSPVLIKKYEGKHLNRGRFVVGVP